MPLLRNEVLYLSGVITALTGADGLSASTFYTEVTALVPFIVLMVPIALGLYFLRKMVKGAGKGKVRF